MRVGWIAAALAAAMCVARVCAADTTQFLRNGGFENAAGWSLGSGIRLDAASPRTGRRALRVDATLGAQAEQIVHAVRPAGRYTLSGWVRTRDVAPREGGGFAYLAVYEIDAEGRNVWYADIAQFQGTRDWTRVERTFTVEPGAEYVSIRAGIHNAAGTAWFDDVSLVPGEAAAPWREPARGLARAPAYRAAILHEPGFPVRGAATPLPTFARAFGRERIPLTPLSATALADPARFSADRYDLLVIPTGATFPLAARRGLLDFLMGGGDLLCTGGYAFDDLQVREARGWLSYRRYLERETARARDPRRHLLPNGGFEDGLAEWSADNAARCRAVEEDPFAGSLCARVQVGSPADGARISAELPVKPGRGYLVGARVRTRDVKGSGFAFLAVYQYDRDGKLVTFRDFVQRAGTTGWRRDEYHFDVAPSAARVVLNAGLYLASGTLWVDQATLAPMPREERINAHYGEPADGLVIAPTQLTIFSPDQPLAGASLASALARPPDLPTRPERASAATRVAGFEATAQLRQNARWLPLLECRDRHGRPAGAAGALVTHYAGPFAGGRWAIFGVTSRDVFAGPEGERRLRRAARLLRLGVRAERLEPGLSIYRAGETARLRLEVANASRARRRARVVLTLFAPERPDRPLRRETRSAALDPASRASIELAWKVPAGAPDFVQARADIAVDGTPVDLAETGFCVYNARVMQGGPRVVFRRNAFEVTRTGSGRTERRMLFGTDTYGNMFGSRSASPLTWFRDLRMMRDNGLHMFENLQYTPPLYSFTEPQWRQFDALIQLSQRFGLPYMAGLLIGHDVAVDDDVLARQAAMCREFARRYRDVPGLIYYLNGDFQLALKDTPDIRRLWNEFLTERHGTDAALRRAWAPADPGGPLGQAPVRAAPSSGWMDARARDLTAFRSALVTRWVSALRTAIRSVDRLHPITSEYYQRPIDGIDLRLTMDGMDAANYGYFGPQPLDIAQMLATIKWNDMRLAGKSVNIGEFGVKTHDAWARDRGPGGYLVMRTEPEQRRLFWNVVHAGLGWDVTKIQNWCWSDDPDSVFPWGIAWNNPLRPKPVLRLYRNLRVLSDLVRRDERTPSVVLVMPDTLRQSAPDALQQAALLNALECLLAVNVPYHVANEADLPGLARGALPAAVLVPLAYALPDVAVDALRESARRGSRVYLSGDPAVTPGGERDDARLRSLCGVAVDEVRSGPSGLPRPVVRPDGAEALGSVAGHPLYRFRLGDGDVWYTPDPWETLPDRDLWTRDAGVAASPAVNLYLGLPWLASMPGRLEVRADTGAWRASALGSGPDRLVTLFSRTERGRSGRASVRTARGSLGWDTRPGWACAALLNGAGRVRAATGVRALRDGSGAEIAAGESPWMLAALDGRALDAAAALAISATDGGVVRWRSSTRALRAWTVEWRDGRLSRVAPAPLRRHGGAWEARLAPNELALVCPERDAARCLAALSR